MADVISGALMALNRALQMNLLGRAELTVQPQDDVAAAFSAIEQVLLHVRLHTTSRGCCSALDTHCFLLVCPLQPLDVRFPFYQNDADGQYISQVQPS
jgi:hypothetical protein